MADGGEQVGGVVGVHRLEQSGRPLLAQVRQQVLLVVPGELLDDIGQPFVVERLGHLVAALAGKLVQRARHVGRSHALEQGEQGAHPLGLVPQLGEPAEPRVPLLDGGLELSLEVHKRGV